jgi:hypothetical protein
MNTTPIVTPNVPATIPVVETKTYEYDANNDDLPF